MSGSFAFLTMAISAVVGGIMGALIGALIAGGQGMVLGGIGVGLACGAWALGQFS